MKNISIKTITAGIFIFFTSLFISAGYRHHTNGFKYLRFARTGANGRQDHVIVFEKKCEICR